MAIYLYDDFKGYTKLTGENTTYKTNEKVTVQKAIDDDRTCEGCIARVANTIFEYYGNLRRERVEVEILLNGKERSKIFVECFVGDVTKYQHVRWKKPKESFDLSAARKLVNVVNKERNETLK